MAYTWAQKSPNGYEVSSKGDKRFSALFACMPDGKFLAVEVKDVGKKNTLTPLQKENLEQISQIGIAILADCVDDIKGVFNEN